MLEVNSLTLIAVIFFVGLLIYRLSFFRDRTLGYFSLLQIVYLVLIPGLIFPLVFSYIRSITNRAMNDIVVVPDGFLLNMIYLAILFTYGGIAIHSVAKMLSEVMPDNQTDPAVRMNRFFHFTFSHNLIYGGGMIILLGISLLELNHTPALNDAKLSGLVIRGLLLGIGLLFSIYNYQPYATSRWSDLRSLFLVAWLGFMVVLYGVRKVRPEITEYQLLLPALMGFALMTFLSLLMVARRVKRGWRVYLSKKRLRRLMYFWEG